MGRAISRIIKWIFSFGKSSDSDDQQNNPNETLPSPPLLPIISSSTNISIIIDCNSNDNNNAAPLQSSSGSSSRSNSFLPDTNLLDPPVDRSNSVVDTQEQVPPNEAAMFLPAPVVNQVQEQEVQPVYKCVNCPHSDTKYEVDRLKSHSDHFHSQMKVQCPCGNRFSNENAREQHITEDHTTTRSRHKKVGRHHKKRAPAR